MKAAIYLRVSTEEQDEGNQLNDCEEFCKDKGFIVPKEAIYREQKSAWKKGVERMQLGAMLDKARKGDYQHIVFWDFDRLYRDREKIVETVRAYSAMGVKFHSVRQGFMEELHKVPAPWNQIIYDLLLQVLGWTSEEESQRKSDRIKAKYQRKKMQAEKRGSKVKWGRRRVPFTTKQVYDAVQEHGSYSKAQKHLTYLTKDRKTKHLSTAKISLMVNEYKDNIL